MMYRLMFKDLHAVPGTEDEWRDIGRRYKKLRWARVARTLIERRQRSEYPRPVYKIQATNEDWEDVET